MTKTIKALTGFGGAAVTAVLVLVGCSDNTTETLTPPTTVAEEVTPPTTEDVTRPTTPQPTSTTETDTTSTTTTVAEGTSTTIAEPDTPVTTTTKRLLPPDPFDVVIGDAVGLDGQPKTIKLPPRITTTTTTTPPTTTTTAPPPPKTDADFRAIAAAGGIPYDPDSPNGIHISYFWPDGIPEVPSIPDSQLRDDLHLFERYGIKLPEGAKFTCDSLEPRYGGTLRELWEIILAGSHYQHKEPYHDCEWAVKWYEFGCRSQLTKVDDSELWELYPFDSRFIRNDQIITDETPEAEVASLIFGAGRQNIICWPGWGDNPE